MIKRKMRFLCSPTIAIFTLVILLSVTGIYIFTVVYEPCRIGLLARLPLLIVWSIFSVVFPIIYIRLYARKLYSIITVDEKGISRSFLGIFFKLHISWDNMAEVCYFVSIVEFLVFSKSKKLSTMSYNRMRLEKDAIELTLSKKRYAVIKQYLQQPIVGMSDKVKARLEGEKKK